MDRIRVLSVRDYDKKRKLAVLDNDVTLLLYTGDIRKFGMESTDGESYISTETYNAILDMLVKRGKERALYILKTSDKSRNMLSDMLKRGMYPAEVIDGIMDFLEEYGYIDDERYCVNYIKAGLAKKSLKLLCNELIYKKGADRDTVMRLAAGFEEDEISGDKVIRDILVKKHYDRDKADAGEKRRISAYLLRRGFDYESVMRNMNSI